MKGERLLLKVGSKLHNSIGVILIIVSIALAIIYWDESIGKSIFYFIFAIGIGALLVVLTRKRKEIERKGDQ